MNWQLQSAEIPQTVEELIAILAKNRRITTPEQLTQFLNPVHPNAISPQEVGFDLDQLKTAFTILLEARKNKSQVVICGDYDADGICATAVMWQALHVGGWQVTPFIPDRHTHGYGLSHAAIDDLLKMSPKPEVIITVDNGIVAHEPTQRLEEAGISVLITDHHQPEKDAKNQDILLPPATSVVYSTALCGTTVAWMFARELAAVLPQPDSDHMSMVTEKSLDLAGLATIADQVPLLNYNRAFGYFGIEALRTTKRPGIIALLESSRSKQEEMSETTVSFRLAPRINAMGRLEHGMDALRLLCTKQIAKAREFATTMNQTNVRRQDVTADQFELAKQQADMQKNEHIIIVHEQEFHEGVIGLIAGKLVEEYSKPAIVISSSDTQAKASARSIHGVNIVELIRLVRHDLLEVGGHPMAAGFGVLNEKIDTVIEQLHTLAKQTIASEELVPTLMIESKLPVQLVSLEAYEAIATFAPFGQRNPEPLWQATFDEVVAKKSIGSNGEHCKITLKDSKTGCAIDALGWGLAQHIEHVLNSAKDKKQTVSCVFALEINTWRGQTTLQMRLVDVSS